MQFRTVDQGKQMKESTQQISAGGPHWREHHEINRLSVCQKTGIPSLLELHQMNEKTLPKYECRKVNAVFISYKGSCSSWPRVLWAFQISLKAHPYHQE